MIDFSRKVLITYLTAGVPDMDFTIEAASIMQDAGVSAVEIGIPYSDPVADGPTIAEASMRALELGINTDKILDALQSANGKLKLPIYLMSYYSPIYTYGFDHIAAKAKKAGVTGIIFPDLPLDEGQDVFLGCKRENLDPILLAFPNTDGERLEQVAEATGSFLYYVNLFGTTGVRERIPEESMAHLKKVKSAISKPVCAGFGVSNRNMYQELSAVADGVIVGSAIMKLVLKRMKDRKEALQDIKDFVTELLGG